MGHAISRSDRARRTLAWLLLTLLSVATLGALAAPTASASNTLVSSVPANNETLATSPTSMTFTFLEPLGPTNVAIATCNGEAFPIGGVTVSPDRLTATVSVPNPFPKGSCSVVVNVSSPDSSANGSAGITFNITADAAPVATAATVAPTDPAATASTVAVTATGTAPVTDPAAADDAATADDEDRVGGPLGLSRLVATLAVAVLFGSIVLIVVAWPEGVEYILTVRFLRSVWVVALFASVCVAIFLTAQTTGGSVGASLSPTAWIDLKDSVPGLATLARVALVAGCGWVVMRPERCLDQQSQLMAIGVPALAVATFGLSRSGGDLVLVGYAAGVLHALAMAVWLGGVVLLTRVVLAGPGEDDLVHAVRGFSRISAPALIVTVATGVVLAWRLDRGAFLDTSHGRLVLLKGLLVAAMVAVAVATRQFVRSRMRKAESMTAPMASRLRRATGIEATGGLFVLVLTAWMLSLTPAGLVDTGDGVDYAYDQGRFVMEDAGADLTVFLTGGVGPNGVRVEVDAPESGLSSVQVTFRPPDVTLAPTVVLTMPAELSGTGAAVLPESEGVPLLVAGVWTMEVTVTTATGTQTLSKTFVLA